MQVSLLKAFKSVNQVDSLKDRQDFFDYYVNKHLLAKLLINFHSYFKGTLISSLMYYTFAARYLIKKPYTTTGKYKLLATVDYVNEERSIADFLYLVGDKLNPVNRLYNINLFFFLLTELFKEPKNFLRVLKFLVKFERKGTFLTCCRIAELFFLYEVAKFRVRSENVKGIAIATNYTPCACGLVAAAEIYKIPSIYTFHAIVPLAIKIPRLRVDFACLYGENALNGFSSHGEISCKVITYSGLSGESWEMKIKDSIAEVSRVGVFLTAYIDEKCFDKLLSTLNNDPKIKEIIIRPHPLKVANPDLSILSKYNKARIDAGGRVVSSAHKCDLVIAGSSAVHVEVLKSGVPTLYWEDFDTVGPDYYGFIKDGIVCEVKDIEKINWNSVRDFYSESWVKRFQKLDYSYLKDKEEIINNIKSELIKVLNYETI